jgi:putative protease
MIEYIPELVKAGINSFKVEGRMKTALYVATVARTYRKAIDEFFADPDLYEAHKSDYMKEIRKGVNRQFTTGFFFSKPTHEEQIYDHNTYEKAYTYLGTISGEKEGLYELEQKNKFSVGECVEIIKPSGDTIEVVVIKIQDADGNAMESCPHPQQVIYVDFGVSLGIYDIVRRKE